MAPPRLADLPTIRDALHDLGLAAKTGDTEAALNILNQLVPEFAHNPTGTHPSPLAVSQSAR